jgi:hypothetical protein
VGLVRGAWRGFGNRVRRLSPYLPAKSFGVKKAYLCSCMSIWHDIDVNLLSNAIWALGGYVISQAYLFKKIISQAPVIFKKNLS